MSRRDSRINYHAAPQDALNEFEAFRKKCLLANRHITKVNAALGIRIEDLNSQISTLVAENANLRTRGIALYGRLKKERARTRRMMAEAEAAATGLVKYFGAFRKSCEAPVPSLPATEAPRPKFPVHESTLPPPPRLARSPDFPGILEEEEEGQEPSPPQSLRKKPRQSVDRLPMPTRPPSPLGDLAPETAPLPPREPTSRRENSKIAASPNVTSRRPRHRTPSATDDEELSFNPPRASSPDATFEVRAAAEVPMVLVKRSRSSRSSEATPALASTSQVPLDVHEKLAKRKNRSLLREEDEAETPALDDAKSRASDTQFTDITNSPRRKLVALDSKKPDLRRHSTPESDADAPNLHTPGNAIASSSAAQYPTPSSAGSNHRAEDEPHREPGEHMDVYDDAADAAAGGRERRTRKSVNYAEPKLNTKMRKPREREEAGAKRRTSSTPRPRTQEKAPWATPVDLPHEDSPEPERQFDEPDERDEEWQLTAVKRKRSSAASSQPLRIAVFPDDGEDSDGTHSEYERGVTSRRRSSHARAASGEGRRYSSAV